ncbi:YDG/SRA domain-containing protein [Lutibacter citreus]|uniref:YDG/SRA domain-containing protein n=1 Tax=Lutibacter citreus TaxID=2138210 RepID=UPI000DBE7280|nr:YDG/SRA domain-containing protein [Lutibacter citreus]
MADYQFGNIENVKEGDKFVNRQALRDAGIHLAPVAGIDGNPRVGAPSIVLNGGYVDDLDLGDEIIYTGHGGNDPSSKKQIKDQSWDATGNKALIVSEMQGLPIRVTRGFKHKSKFSPKEGYVYGGLYYVTDHFEEKGKNGFVICRYKLEKVSPSETWQNLVKKELPLGNENSKRIATEVLRIVRDTKLSKEIKKLYNYECQICGTTISVRGARYAEAAHIKPLGKPHNGNDQPGNLICLCPNHHVMFDKGVFAIENDLSLVGIEGSLSLHKNHTIEKSNFDYHKEHIFINE